MSDKNHHSIVEEEYTFRRALESRKEDFGYLWSNKVKLLILGFIGCALGCLFAWLWPVSYTARTTFVVEESKASGGGLMSSLAGSIGLDIGSLMGGTGGVLAGDNVMQLLISQKMLKETLLSPFQDGNKETIADKYVKVNKLDQKWAKFAVNGALSFPGDEKVYTRVQDSLLNEIIRQLAEKQVSVNKPDKKLSFFALNTTMKSQELAARFNHVLIAQATKFYIETKTMRLTANVNKLQHRADSLERLLNRKTMTSSASNRDLLDLNPAYVTANVPSELQEREKRLVQATYGEIVKNLEVSRTMLMQETPTFQIVDEPMLPIRKNKLKYSTLGAAGFILASLSGSLLLLFRRRNQGA